MFESIFGTATATTTSVELLPLLASVAASLGLGFVLALAYCFRCRHTKSFVMTLAILPAIVCVVIAYQCVSVGPFGDSSDRSLRITVPEDLDFSDLFDDVLAKYTNYYELVSVKTTNMGSLYRLVYNVGLRDLTQQRALVDELRCRNGNLEIAIAHQEANGDEL